MKNKHNRGGCTVCKILISSPLSSFETSKLKSSKKTLGADDVCFQISCGIQHTNSHLEYLLRKGKSNRWRLLM